MASLRRKKRGARVSVQEAKAETGNGTYEVKVVLPDEAVEVLQRYAAMKGITVTEALRQFISNERFLLEQVAEGGSVLIESKDGKIQKLAFA
jgi:hypothetical protein